MKGSRQKRMEALANESSHGRQLLMILSVLRADLATKRKEYARERNEGRKASIARSIAQVEGLVALREAELRAAIDAVAAEKATA